jgi:hypothetical protein
MRYLHFTPAVLVALFLIATAHAQFLGGVPLPFVVNASSGPTGNSLIFTAASSQYLSSAGSASANQQKFTIATWVKPASTGAGQTIFITSNTLETEVGAALQFLSSNHLSFVTTGGGTTDLITTATYTDTTNWHHVLIGVDTTQATASNRALLYYDGTLVSSFGTSTYPSQNSDLFTNLTNSSFLGSGQTAPAGLLNGKLAQVYYIDGQQLTPSSFITGTPGLPKTYSGTYTGHFDFFLPFSNGTSTTTLGADSSGESNNWTLNNMTTANQSTDYP